MTSKAVTLDKLWHFYIKSQKLLLALAEMRHTPLNYQVVNINNYVLFFFFAKNVGILLNPA